MARRLSDSVKGSTVMTAVVVSLKSPMRGTISTLRAAAPTWVVAALGNKKPENPEPIREGP